MADKVKVVVEKEFKTCREVRWEERAKKRQKAMKVTK